MIDIKIKEHFIALSNTKKFSETMLANELSISVSSIRKLKKEFNTPDYDSSIRRKEIKESIILNSNTKGTDLAHRLGISYSLLTQLKAEIKRGL